MLAGFALATPPGASADVGAAADAWSGRVCVDADRDGACADGETGLAGAVVSNGRELVRSAADGAWQLSPGRHFSVLTCPTGYTCPEWYAGGAHDFALRPAAAPDQRDGFTFIQISDAHVYRDPADFTRFSLPLPDWLPEGVSGWLGMRFLARMYDPLGPEDIAARLRAALPEPGPAREASPGGVLLAWIAEFARPGSPSGRVAEAQRAAFAELAALAPDFVISTGDLALEGNNASPDAIEGWLAWYRELAASTGLRFFHTIGNNEIAGDANDAFPLGDPRFGKGAWRQAFGPTHYSFDRGDFHFVALDTHSPDPGWLGSERAFSFYEMESEVRAWLEADLAAHSDRVRVVLNHEPFAGDPGWPFEIDAADDEGLFAAFDVPYVLAGHIHRNGYRRVGATEHIATGALSGSRWMLPVNLHARGYRIFLARDRRLFHAWKELGRPLLALAERDTGPDAGVWVIAAASAAGPVASLLATCAGVPLEVERWGPYFARVELAAGAPGPKRSCDALRLEARLADGTRLERVIGLAPGSDPPPGGPSR